MYVFATLCINNKSFNVNIALKDYYKNIFYFIRQGRALNSVLCTCLPTYFGQVLQCIGVPFPPEKEKKVG